MQTATLNLTLSRSDNDLRRAARFVSLPDWLLRVVSMVFSALVARKLRRIAETISTDVLNTIELTRMVEGIDEQSQDLIDPDCALTRHLWMTLDRIKSLHLNALEITSLGEGINSAKITESARQFVAVCSEYYTAVSTLSWAIREHDANHATRLINYTASTPEEVTAMLDRIVAEG